MKIKEIQGKIKAQDTRGQGSFTLKLLWQRFYWTGSPEKRKRGNLTLFTSAALIITFSNVTNRNHSFAYFVNIIKLNVSILRSVRCFLASHILEVCICFPVNYWRWTKCCLSVCVCVCVAVCVRALNRLCNIVRANKFCNSSPHTDQRDSFHSDPYSATSCSSSWETRSWGSSD